MVPKSKNSKTPSGRQISNVAICQHMVQHFIDIFSSPGQLGSLDFFVVHQVIPNIVTEHQNLALIQILSSLEIKQAVFDMDKDSTPGPDGFGAAFYQSSWEDIARL